MNDQGSVTIWLDCLKAGKKRDEAVAQLWARYFTRLVNRARHQLRSRARASDEEDVALAAFDSFVRAAEAGRFPRLGNRNDLWQLLLLLTARKAANVLRDENRQCRGRGRVVRPLNDAAPNSCGSPIPSDSPDPAEVVALVEQVEQLLSVLGTDELRRVAVWALEGYTNREIAERLGKSVVTAERKLRLIRGIWHTHVPM
jgi:DNA-directed RNA polymerase specialized sigma24 family protein